MANASGTYPVVRSSSQPAQGTHEITLSDRRRPGRGFGTDDSQPMRPTPTSRATLRTSIGHGVGELLFEALRTLLVVLLLPFQVLYLVVRPAELARRLREAPTRVHSIARRLRLQTRDPETAPGRLWESARLSAHFVREELADMQDGFPSFDQVAREGARGLAAAGGRVGRGLGRRITRGSEGLVERLHHSAVMGVVAGIVVVGLFVAGYQGLESLKQSERLAIQEISVQGLSRVAREDLLGTLRVGQGDNLLELDTELLVARAAAQPWIRSLSLKRDLRAQRLEVAVVEHEPVLLLASAPMQLLNEAGEAFKQLEASDPIDLPFLTVHGQAADLSDPAQLQEASRGAVQILHALSSGNALSQVDVSEIRFEGAAGYVVVTRTGLPIRVGREEFAARLGRLERAAGSGALPLHALASVDLGLRDRLVAVPLAARSARRVVRNRVAAQPIAPQQREQVIEMEQARLPAVPDLWGTATP